MEKNALSSSLPKWLEVIPRRRSLFVALGCCAGYLLAYLVPMFGGFAISAGLIIRELFVARNKWKALFYSGVIVGCGIRAIILVFVFAGLIAEPTRVSSYGEKRPVTTVVVLGNEVGIWEGAIRGSAETLARGDVFSGQPLRSKNGVTYSVGPDGIDNGFAVVYDPTNGVTSTGDIFVSVTRNDRAETSTEK